MTFREKFLMFFGLVAILLVIQQITMHPVLLVPLGAVAAGLYYLIQQRRVAKQQPSKTASNKTLMDRVNKLGEANTTGSAGAAPFDPSDKASLGRFLKEFSEYNLNLINVAKSEETTDAPHFKVAARLDPLVPIPDGHLLRSWIGGNPRLPDPFVWPERGGVPYYFLAQVDCSELPEDLWGGRGPRSGWLAFFCSGEGRIASKAIHTATLGPERHAPAGQASWLHHDYDVHKHGLDKMFSASPEWPVRVMRAEAAVESQPSSDDNPTVRKEIDLTLPEYQPHSWATAQLLLTTARHDISTTVTATRGAVIRTQVALAAGDTLAQRILPDAKALLDKLVLKRNRYTLADWAPVAKASVEWRRLDLEEMLSGPAPLGQIFYMLAHSSWPMRDHLAKTGRKDTREHAQLAAINAAASETWKLLVEQRKIGHADDFAAWSDFKTANQEEWQLLAQQLRVDFAIVDGICARIPGLPSGDKSGHRWGRLYDPIDWPASGEEAEKLLGSVVAHFERKIAMQAKMEVEAPEQIMRNERTGASATQALTVLDGLIVRAKTDAMTKPFGSTSWGTFQDELLRVYTISHKGEKMHLLTSRHWGWTYVKLRNKLAVKDYSKSPLSLPQAQRDFLEAHWGWLAKHETAKLGGLPQGWSYEIYDNTKTVAVLFEAPWNDLMGWHFGDVKSFVATIDLNSLAKGDFSSTGAEITN